MAKKLGTVAPRLDNIELVGLTDGESALLRAHESYDGERFLLADLSERDLVGAAFSDCEFLDLTAHDCDFRAAGFADTRFERLNAPIFKAPRSRFRNVDMDGSRLGSAEFYGASWQSVHISNSKLGFINLRGAELRDVLFTNCTIDELDLGDAKANRVSFVNTTVNNLDLTHSTLQHVDLRALEIRRLSGLEGLKGATVNSFQLGELAPLLARHLGIKVED
jgi:hypothetical protein